MQKYEIEIPSPMDSPYQEISYKHTDELENLIGSGATADIFRGDAYPHDGTKDVVIKVPKQSYDISLLHQEHEILSEINRITTDLHPQKLKFVPETWLGRRKEDGREVLVMPLYTKKLVDEVRQSVNKHDYITAEKLASHAIIDFTYPLEAVHQRQRVVKDRKINDFFLLNDRTIIIDWNVYQEYSPTDAREEINIVGRLWYQLFLGQQKKPPYFPYVDSEWMPAYESQPHLGGAVSLGMRRLISALVDMEKEGFQRDGEPDMQLLREAFERWLMYLDMPTENLLQYAGEIERGEKSVFLFGENMLLTSKEARAILIDLAWRSKGASSEDALFQEREQVLEERELEKTAIFREVYRLLEQGNPRPAKQRADEMLAYFQSEGDFAAWGHLSRWNLYFDLNEGGAFDRFANGNLSPHKVTLQELFNNLVSEVVEDKPENLQEIEKALSPILQQAKLPVEENVLNMLLAEVQLRSLILKYNQIPDSEFKDRIKHFNQIESLLQQAEYFIPLVNQVLPIEKERREIGQLRNLEEKSQQVYAEKQAQLQNKEYKAVIDWYQSLTTSVIDQYFKEHAKAIYDVARYADFYTNSDTAFPDAVERGEQLLKKLEDGELHSVVCQVQIQALYPQIDRLKAAVEQGEYEKLAKTSDVASYLEAMKSRMPPVYIALSDEVEGLDGLLDKFEQQERFFGEVFDLLLENKQIRPFSANVPTLSHVSSSLPENLRFTQHLINLLKQEEQIGVNMSELKKILLEKSSNVPIGKIIELGLSEELEEQVNLTLEDFQKDLDEQVKQKLEEALKQLEQQQHDVKSLTDKINSDRDTYERFQNELKSRLDGDGRDIDRLREELEEQKTRLNEYHHSIEGIKGHINILERQKTQVDGYGQQLSELERLENTFANNDIEQVKRVLSQIKGWCKQNPGNPFLDDIRIRLHQWYELLQTYERCKNRLENNQQELNAIKDKKQPQRKELLWQKLASLEEFMQNTPILIFKALYKDWKEAFEATHKTFKLIKSPLNENQQQLLEDVLRDAEERIAGYQGAK